MYQRLSHSRSWLTRTVALSVTVGAVSLSGCSSLDLMNGRKSVDKQIEQDRNYSIAGVQGPAERNLSSRMWDRKREEIASDPDSEMAVALAEYEQARKLYDAEDYAAAEKSFQKLAKERRSRHESFGARFRRFWGMSDRSEYDPYSNFGDPIEEDALFMAGEAQFAQKKYAAAQNSYEELFNRYPSTRHLDRVTRQLFRIARYWLEFHENVGEKGDVQLADGQTAEQAPKRTSSGARLPLPNFTDKSRPVIDTHGRGLQALRSIWLHDATGPLADDALMLAANHHLRTENFVEAARLYTLLREQYPDSPHFKDAFLLGSHVRLATYQGPAYDGRALEDARGLKQTMLQIFPDLTPEERQRLQSEIEKLQEAEIARTWDLVEFYKVKGVDSAVALHCHLIINKYPDSRFAGMARQTLREQEEKANRPQNLWPRRLSQQPQLPDQAGSPDDPQTSGRSRLTLPAERADGRPGEPEAGGQTPSANPFKRFGNMLRRAEQPPELQPVEPDARQRDILNSDPPGRTSL